MAARRHRCSRRLLRFWDLGRPHQLVFDETYYVKDAYSLLVHGYEATWGEDPNPAFEAGDDQRPDHDRPRTWCTRRSASG